MPLLLICVVVVPLLYVGQLEEKEEKVEKEEMEEEKEEGEEGEEEKARSRLLLIGILLGVDTLFPPCQKNHSIYIHITVV